MKRGFHQQGKVFAYISILRLGALKIHSYWVPGLKNDSGKGTALLPG